MLEPDTVPGSFEAIAEASIQLPFQVELPRLMNGDLEKRDRPALVSAVRRVLLTLDVSGVGTDTSVVAHIRELGHLLFRRPFGHKLEVDLAFGLAGRADAS
jgi:hypothetical protein